MSANGAFFKNDHPISLELAQEGEYAVGLGRLYRTRTSLKLVTGKRQQWIWKVRTALDEAWTTLVLRTEIERSRIILPRARVSEIWITF